MIYNCPKCGLSKSDGAMSSTLPQCKCDWNSALKREWQGLTDDEYEAMAEQYVTNCYFDTLKYARAIEAKLKEKNT